MTKYDFSKNETVATYYITNDGDVVDNLRDAKQTGWAVAEVIVDGFYVGSLDDMRRQAKRLYEEATQND